jgi:hypothetical protein
MSDSTAFDSTHTPLSEHEQPGVAQLSSIEQVLTQRGRRMRPGYVVFALAILACSDRRIRFCNPDVGPPNGCPVAGAGGGGAGGAAGNAGIAGSSGAAGVAGSGGVAGTGGSAGTAGAPATGGTGGLSDLVDASAPLLDAGADASGLDAATP